jgi:hypothetical protein
MSPADPVSSINHFGRVLELFTLGTVGPVMRPKWCPSSDGRTDFSTRCAAEMTEGKEKGMTFKDKLRAMNPEGGEAGVEEAMARLCPADLGFESETPESCPNMCLKAGTYEDCCKCWEREAEP